MSIEHDQSTRKAMRAGISGENVLRPLDEFSVTTTEKPDVPAGYWEALDKAFRAAQPILGFDLASGPDRCVRTWFEDGHMHIEEVSVMK